MKILLALFLCTFFSWQASSQRHFYKLGRYYSRLRTGAGLVIYRTTPKKAIEFLLMQPKDATHWTPPKGRLEPEDQNELAAAYRETEEQTGFKNEDLRIYMGTKRVLYYKALHPKKVTYWLTKLKNRSNKPQISKDVYQSWKWLQLKDAFDMVGCYEMRKTLQYYEFFIKEYVLTEKLAD